jgi:hypothetical protein
VIPSHYIFRPIGSDAPEALCAAGWKGRHADAVKEREGAKPGPAISSNIETDIIDFEMERCDPFRFLPHRYEKAR